MLTALLVATSSAAPSTSLGAEWRPLSRGDLSWVDGGSTTGLIVGGLDGFVRPNLSAYGGAWLSERTALQGSLGVARLQNTTIAGEIVTQRHWGVVRPAVELRYALLPHTQEGPVPWLLGGLHVDIPSARETSNGFTPEEQELANEIATLDRLRLGAFGGRVGIGASVELIGGLAVGLQYALIWQRSLFLGEDPTAATSLLIGEAGLLLQLQWPGGSGSEPEQAE